MLKINEKIFGNCCGRFEKKDSLTADFHRISLNLVFIILCWGLVVSPPPALGNDRITDDILTAIEKKYTGNSFVADFTQTSRLSALDIEETATGKAFFSHPGKMRWEYKEPDQHEIITNGTQVWIFRPDENQVMQGDASEFFKAGAGGSFLSDISLIRKNFTIQGDELTDDYAKIHLVNPKKNPEMSLIVIWISRKTDEIVKIIIHNIYGDTTRLEFHNIQFKQIEPDTFEFKPFEGLNIIELQ